MRSGKKFKKRFIEAEDICRFSITSSAVLSPNEKKTAITIENVSDDKRKYFSRIHMADNTTGEVVPFTFGEVNDRGVMWSPDGAQFAFVSTRNKKSGIYLMSVSGGSERLLLEMDGSFTGLCWTPDGKEIVFQFRFNDSHSEKDETKKKEAPLFRHITRLFYRLDGSGFLPKDRFHIWKVDIESGKAVQLTKGKHDEMSPSISSNGKLICFVSNRSKDPDLETLKDDLFTVGIDGGKEKKIPAPAGPKSSPSFSPDSKKIAYLGHTNTDDAWGVTNFHVWTVGVHGKPAAKDIIPKFDRMAIDVTIGDIGDAFSQPSPVWTPDGKRLYFCASDMGCTHIFYVPAKGGLPTRVTKKECHIKGYSFGKTRRKIAAVVSNLKTPGEISVFPSSYEGDKKAHVISSPCKSLLSGIDSPVIKEVRFKAYDGTELQGWLVTPPSFSKTKKYPGVLEIHGGPRTQYGFTYYHEMLYLASRGYVVFYTNPRGGQGRGETFAGTIVGDWGTIDYSDCMAAADYLSDLPYVNTKKIGVTGGSYGGYMTNWIIGHTNRFKAAVTQRSVVDLRSFFGSSDIGYDLKQEFLGTPWTAEETYTRCSPITYAKNIKTPLLIIHSEQDLRCSIEQAEQLFVMLKLMKKTVEFVRFPEEPHGLSRHGRPDRRIARLELIAKWFKRYLK
ncbi:MAG: S9 family peptidase [candidate division Zixibacteria bacterium]|nr:S9 family peptidase [candidate division Zixibacteria bacterium]